MPVMIQILHTFEILGANSAKTFLLIEIGWKYYFTFTLNQLFFSPQNNDIADKLWEIRFYNIITEPPAVIIEIVVF